MQAVIFDLDGVLVDSEPNYLEAERRLLAEFGVEFTQEMKRPYIGMSSKEMLDDVVLRFGIPEAVDALLARKNAYYLEVAAKSTPAYEQTRELLIRLHANGYPLALASGSSPEVIEVVLAAADLRDYFRVVVSAEEVAQGKPAPDLFLVAAERLGVEPDACVVIEDSAYGVQAALAAGMQCVAIPYLTDPPLDPTFAKASLLIEGGMAAMNAEAVFEWIRVDQDAGSSDTPSNTNLSS